MNNQWENLRETASLKEEGFANGLMVYDLTYYRVCRQPYVPEGRGEEEEATDFCNVLAQRP